MAPTLVLYEYYLFQFSTIFCIKTFEQEKPKLNFQLEFRNEIQSYKQPNTIIKYHILYN